MFANWKLPLAVALLCLLSTVQSYLQFEQVLAPKEVEIDGFVCTLKATYGTPSDNYWRRIGRTAEDHNCILPGCTLMGEVLNIQSNNVTKYDVDTLKDLVDNKKRAVSLPSSERFGILMLPRLKFLTTLAVVSSFKRSTRTVGS